MNICPSKYCNKKKKKGKTDWERIFAKGSVCYQERTPG